jgi:hypothetical protein
VKQKLLSIAVLLCCGFLLQYGLMSNLDVGTEHLRWMGDTRFLLGLLWVSSGYQGSGQIHAALWLECCLYDLCS